MGIYLKMRLLWYLIRGAAFQRALAVGRQRWEGRHDRVIGLTGSSVLVGLTRLTGLTGLVGLEVGRGWTGRIGVRWAVGMVGQGWLDVGCWTDRRLNVVGRVGWVGMGWLAIFIKSRVHRISNYTLYLESSMTRPISFSDPYMHFLPRGSPGRLLPPVQRRCVSFTGSSDAQPGPWHARCWNLSFRRIVFVKGRCRRMATISSLVGSKISKAKS